MLVLGGIGDSVRRVAERLVTAQQSTSNCVLTVLSSAELSCGFDAYTPLDILGWNKQSVDVPP